MTPKLPIGYSHKLLKGASETMGDDLKPCPKCGGEAIVEYEWDTACYVACIDCGYRTKTVGFWDIAADAWNALCTNSEAVEVNNGSA